MTQWEWGVSVGRQSGARTTSLVGWLSGLVVGGVWMVMVMCLDRVWSFEG